MGLEPGWADDLGKVLGVSSWALFDVGSFRFKDGGDTGRSALLTLFVVGLGWVANVSVDPTRDVPEEA